MGQVAKLERTWILAPLLQIVQKFLKIKALAHIYQLAKFGDLMIFGSENIFKNAPILMY